MVVIAMWLGILLTAALASTNTHGYVGVQTAGHSIHYVSKVGPAYKAGIRSGDRVLLINGRKKGEIDGTVGVPVRLFIKHGKTAFEVEIERVTHSEAFGD